MQAPPWWMPLVLRLSFGNQVRRGERSQAGAWERGNWEQEILVLELGPQAGEFAVCDLTVQLATYGCLRASYRRLPAAPPIRLSHPRVRSRAILQMTLLLFRACWRKARAAAGRALACRGPISSPIAESPDSGRRILAILLVFVDKTTGVKYNVELAPFEVWRDVCRPFSGRVRPS